MRCLTARSARAAAVREADRSSLANRGFQNKSSETNKNKYYLDLFNFRLIQSFIQNRSNYFKLKNKNIFGLYPTHYQTPDNFSFLLNSKIGIDNMKFSLREIYRNLNNNKPVFNLFQLNQKKKKKIQKKKKRILMKKRLLQKKKRKKFKKIMMGKRSL